jgi:hypothetical protein
MELASQEYFTIFRSRPRRIREILASVEVTSTIADIAKSNNLTLEQRYNLTTVVGNILLGVESEDTVVGSLTIREGIERDRALRIDCSIKEQILQNLDRFHQLMESNIESGYELPYPDYITLNFGQHKRMERRKRQWLDARSVARI